jgi:CheY-like chemotaxis protein
LVISDRIARAMGGSIDVESSPGLGSVFTLTVPLARNLDASAEAEAEPSGPRSATGAVPAFPGASILLVEDNPFNQMVARELLQRTGATVHVASNGKDGVELALSGQGFDLILMDVQMPVMDGLEATRRIRQGPGGRSVTILAMTANVSAEDRTRCRDAGMQDFIAKPIVPEHLYGVLARWLRSAERNPRVSTEIPASVPSEEPAPPARLFDPAMIEDVVGNESQFRVDLVASFAASAQAMLCSAHSAVASNDLAEVERVGHRFKSSAGMIGAQEIRDRAQALETLGREEDAAAAWPRVREHLAALDRLVPALLAQLDAYVDGAGGGVSG